MKVNFLLFCLICLNNLNGQFNKNELNFIGIHGLGPSNNLIYTPLNYEDYGTYSGVNLKCNSINGIQLQYNRFIKNSNWKFSVAYDRLWLNYSTKLYSMNYNPLTSFNEIKELSYDTQVESLSTGIGRRLRINKSRFSIDFIANLKYLVYQDIKIGSLNPIDFSKTNKLETGDFNYFVELDYTDDANIIKFSFQNVLLFQLNSRLSLSFQVTMNSPIIGKYSYENLTRGNEEVIIPGQLIITHMDSSSYNSLGSVATKYLGLGFGLNYKF
jgi:hypothetical protein